MTVGSGVARVGGCVLLYRSKDLKTWEYLHELTSGTWNGVVTANPCDDGQMWECPEFFPLDGGHVLIYSTLGKVFWESGQLDEAAMKFTSSQRGVLDLDSFYAPKTQLDASGRRILWGWVQERRSDAAMRQAGWSGMMSLPRVLNLDREGRLRMQVLPQVSSLRGAALPVSKIQGGATTTLPEANGEVLATGTKGQAMELNLNLGQGGAIALSYSPERHAFTADGKEIQLEPADIPKLHILVDGSVAEIMLSERVGYTKRFYYEGSTAPEIKVTATGQHLKLSAWSIRPISGNRLTTPAATA
jgi:beta-fructofuranosidase